MRKIRIDALGLLLCVAVLSGCGGYSVVDGISGGETPGGSKGRAYVILVEDIGTAGPTSFAPHSIAPQSIFFGCESTTYAHTPTEAWGLDPWYNERFLRAMVLDAKGTPVPDAQVSWSVDPPILTLTDLGSNSVSIVTQQGGYGKAEVMATYDEAVGSRDVIIYEAATIRGNDPDRSGLDLDTGALTQTGADVVALSNPPRIQFPFGAAEVTTPVSQEPMCEGIISPEVKRFYGLLSPPADLTYSSDPVSASTAVYLVTTDQGGLYKVLVGLVGVLNMTELDQVGLIYGKADSDGTFPY